MLIWKRVKRFIIKLWLDILSLVQPSSVSKIEFISLGTTIVIGGIVRGYFLSQPMQYDEAYTYLNFVNQPIFYLFYYPLPNNHVFHTILVKLSVVFFGAHPAAIRFPSFLAGLITIPVIFLVCRCLNARSGLLASLLMAISPYMIFYSDVARGYTLVALFSLILVVFILLFVKRPSREGCLRISLTAALGLFTIPTMLFPIVGLYIWTGLLLLMKNQSLGMIFRRFIFPCGIMTSALALFLYAPTIGISGGIKPLVSNRFVVPQSWGDFFHGLFPHVQDVLSDFSRDIPGYVLIGVMIFLMLGIFAAIRKRGWIGLLLLPSLLLGSAAILILNHRIPFVRVWIFLIPFVAIGVDAGFTYLTDRFSDRIRSIALTLVVLLGASFALSLMARNVIADYTDAGGFSSAPIAAKYLSSAMDTDDTLHVELPSDWPTYFYLWYYNANRGNQRDNDGVQTEFFIVVKGKDEITNMTEKRVIEILDFEDFTLYRTMLPEELLEE